MSNIISRAPLLKPERIAVRAEGEIVVMIIGNTDIKVHYEDALKISQWIRVRAKEAKRNCGDVSRHWSTLAVLDAVLPDGTKLNPNFANG